MGDMAPLPVIAVATFRNQTVNVRIPFEIPAKSMKNHNVTRSKILGFVHFKEHAGNNAGNRIDHYDGESVTFHYNRHEDEKYVEETLPAIDFIKRLIRHIPEKHFKMIRYI